ncbi:uncharacterized protein LOC127577509 [Pristis pectinata]|uniref:uncharacterized protein LOC127577509 n=1 Tax=Pristis pectinata TaxID=685728 RepID=UPI00223E8D3C|nr:uncharacterized protein LOC127577509 [Pristis pectinata]
MNFTPIFHSVNATVDTSDEKVVSHVIVSHFISARVPRSYSFMFVAFKRAAMIIEMFTYTALRSNQRMGIIFVAVSFIVAAEGLFKVVQTPERTDSLVGENVIFSCTFSISEDTSDVDICWWKLGEEELIQPDSRKRIDTGERKISLQLLNLSIDDSGTYYCGVTLKGINLAKGSGSQLIVGASPIPLRILRNGSLPSTLCCKMAPFYPAGLTITWYKNNKSIETGINTTQRLNSAGMFEASSTLHDPQSAQGRSVYTCVASHLTLKIPAMAIYSVPNSNPDRDSIRTSLYFHLKIFGCTGFALAFLVLMVIIGISFRFISCKDL